MSIHNETCPKCGNVFEPDLAHHYDDVLAKQDAMIAEANRLLQECLNRVNHTTACELTPGPCVCGLPDLSERVYAFPSRSRTP